MLPLDSDVVRALVKQAPDVIVLERHRYVDARAFVADLRSQEETAAVPLIPLVLVGPGEPVEVSGVEVVRQRGCSLDLDALLTAPRSASRSSMSR